MFSFVNIFSLVEQIFKMQEGNKKRRWLKYWVIHSKRDYMLLPKVRQYVSFHIEVFIIQRQDRSANEEYILCQGEKFILYLEYESVLNFIIDFICISRLRSILAINISPDRKNT